jgi:rhodanese-related sulfurtransferase
MAGDRRSINPTTVDHPFSGRSGLRTLIGMTHTPTATPGPVTVVAPADPAVAERHFLDRLAFETDPADVAAQRRDAPDQIVLVDTRSAEAYTEAHIPGAVSLPHATIDAEALAALPPDALVVTYCWSTTCNASTKGAARIAGLGRPVKEMIGGIAAWEAEGFALERPAAPRSA